MEQNISVEQKSSTQIHQSRLKDTLSTRKFKCRYQTRANLSIPHSTRRTLPKSL